MDSLELPEILNIPTKLLPLILNLNKYRYFLIDGGRASAKTQGVARLLTYLAEKKQVRIVCGREIQNSVEESVYTVFKDLISNYALNFEVLATKIDHRTTGSSVRFRGFREQGSTDIKGLEGVDILWVDEAQAITKQTLDVIIPTIRKNKAKIFWTMNRHVEQDPVFVDFVNRVDCLHIHVDYRDNNFCPPAMILEADQCKEKSHSDYEHIWLGQPLLKSSDYLFGIDLLRDSIALDMNRIGINRRILGNDVARFGDCETVFTTLESRGPVLWEQTHIEAYRGKGLDETLGRNLSMHSEFGTDAHVIDDDGMGGGITDMLKEKQFEVIGFSAVKDFDNKDSNYHDRRTAAYFKLQDWILRGWLKILNDPVLIQQLLTIRYKYKPNGKKYIMSKDEMRKEQIPSPDRADSLMMAVFYADTLMGPEFADRHPAYAPMSTRLDENNFRYDRHNPEYAGQ